MVMEEKVQKVEKKAPAGVGAIELLSEMTVGEFATKINKSGVEVVKELMRLQKMLSLNDQLELTLALQVAQRLGVPVKRPKQNEFETAPSTATTEATPEVDKSNWKRKAPVVTVMGHVDHGKTTLLDAIRGSAVADKEAGGITQRIGAYQVEYDGNLITFIDTPGHEAFTAMRSNGVQATDIALIVIAADDQIKPQTLEAINHAKIANTTIMIAINKMDLPGSDAEKVKYDLASHDVVVEALGGDVLAVEISAKEKTGIEDLMEAINLVAEVNDLRADSDGEVAGVVIEAHMDKLRGPLTTIILNSGTLRKGDTVVVGLEHGKIRHMIDGNNKPIKELLPSNPAQIMGPSGLPLPGDKLQVVANDSKAKELIKVRRSMQQRQSPSNRAVTMDDLKLSAKKLETDREVNVVLKAATSGSLDALRRTIENSIAGDVNIKVIGSGLGQISVSDILLASVSDGIVLGFDTGIEAGAKKQMTKSKVPVRLYNIIYRLAEDVEAGFSDLIGEVEREVMIGKVLVKQIFLYGESGKIAGVQTIEGTPERDARVRIMRAETEIYNGNLTSMKHLKNDVNELKNQQEGGLMFREFTQFEVGDEVEFYKVQKVGGVD